MVTIFVDFDKTITTDHLVNLINNPPRKNVIDYIEKMYNKGNIIIIYSCRSNPDICDPSDEARMKQYLSLHNIKYHSICRDKPYYDIIIDDKAINPDDLVD